jgi:hypothetical protein
MQFFGELFEPDERIAIGWKDDDDQIRQCEIRKLKDWNDEDILALANEKGYSTVRTRLVTAGDDKP